MAKRLTIALAAAIAAFPSAGHAMPRPGIVYTGFGTEPFWDIRIGRGRMVWTAVDQPTVSAPLPRPTAIAGGRRYATPRLTIEITNEGRCNDGMSDNYYRERVRVWFGRRVGPGLDGCGGERVPWPQLSSAYWYIIAIDGQTAAGDRYFLDFDQGRVTGQAGCNRFSGTYTERRPTLTFGPLAATRMACPEPRMTHEQRVLRILSAPLSMNFVRPDTLDIANRFGRIRLHQGD